MGHKRMDLIGREFGLMRVIAFAGLDARRNSRWLCVCKCGTQKVCLGFNLTRNHIVSCGCRTQLKTEQRAEEHPDWRPFSSMLCRCYHPKTPGYKNYGGRGIVVCDRWREGGFWVFIADMGPRPTPNHSLDRIDNDGPYSPENCRWSTPKQQGRNRRTTVRLTYQGETLPMIEWVERLGLDYNQVRHRYRKGMSAEDILSPHSLA